MTRDQFAESCQLIKKKEIEKAILLAFHFFKSTGTNRFDLKNLQDWFDELHFSIPNTSRLRKSLESSKGVLRASEGGFRLHAATIAELQSFWKEVIPSKAGSSDYVDRSRIEELRKVTSQAFDLSKLTRLVEELNQNYANENYLSVALITRAIIDHVPPIFGCKTFSEIANNYAGSKSFKDSMNNLSSSSRKIGDSHLHTQIRNKEVLPSRTQVDFSNDLDVLFSEIIRILK